MLFFPFPDEREKDNPPIGGGYSAFMGHNGGLILIAHLSCQYTTGFLCGFVYPVGPEDRTGAPLRETFSAQVRMDESRWNRG